MFTGYYFAKKNWPVPHFGTKILKTFAHESKHLKKYLNTSADN